MITQLEDLVSFLHHGNTQIRQIAIENLMGYSRTDTPIFKTGQLAPIKDLKLLIKDYTPIAKNALTILINLSYDGEVVECLANDDAFLESLVLRITNDKEPNANEIAMLLANLAKAEETLRLLKLQRPIPKSLTTSASAIDQLMDCFVKGAEGSYNRHANYDYLSYLFADLAKSSQCRSYFTTPQPHDRSIIPLTKLIVFTEHKSIIRRRGVASTIKNVAFDIAAHPYLLSTSGPDAINVLPYILAPIMGSEEYSDEDTDGMLEDLQLLPADKKREEDVEILKTHMETLLLLTTTGEGRDLMRRIKVYPIVRAAHEHVEDEGVREACDRLVQVIMRDEEMHGEDDGTTPQGGTMVTEAIQEDEDDQIIDVF